MVSTATTHWTGRSRELTRPLLSSFARNVATLAGGQSVAILIPILAAPVLGRLYLPQDYGLLAAYMSISVVASAIGNWQLSHAIVVEGRDDRAWALVRVCVWTSAATATATLLIPLIAQLLPLKSRGLGLLADWLWLVPVAAFMGGVTAALTALANRFGNYRTMAAIQVAAALATTAVSIGLGVLGYAGSGLLFGLLAGQLVAFVGYGGYWLRAARSAPETTVAMSRALLRRHRNFAIYTTPTGFIEQISFNAPVYALSLIGAPAMIGLLARARQLLALPATVTGNAVGQVFQQRAAADLAREGSCRRIFVRTFLMLVGLGLPPTILLALAAPSLFEIYLGPNWRDAGEVARILAPMLFLQLVCSPLSRMFYVRQRQRLDLCMTTFANLAIVATVASAALVPIGPLQLVALYAAVSCAVYMSYLLVAWRLADGTQVEFGRLDACVLRSAGSGRTTRS